MNLKLIVPLVFAATAFTGSAFAQMTEEPAYEINVNKDIVYGQADIRKDGKLVSRDLWMDHYMPVEADGPLPTVIYTHGGSFHIGSPRTGYRVSGAQSSSPADYCRLFASRGFACFAPQYRLGPEEPVSTGKGYAAENIDRKSINLMMDRVEIIRSNLGLRQLDASDPDDNQLMLDTVLSAAEDLHSALDFIIANAGELNVDPERIVLGGFSAGAVTSLNVAHGMNAPVAGVFMLSTAPIAINIYETVTEESAPALIFLGQHDLSGALAGTPPLLAHYDKIGLDYTFAWVPAFGHFYPSGATTMGVDATLKSVEERIVDFVDTVTSN
ncbi:MAG: hypothetical protein AAGA50_11240 [Pseudomonadota bacterium]